MKTIEPKLEITSEDVAYALSRNKLVEPAKPRLKFIVAVYCRISPKGSGRKKEEETSLEVQKKGALLEIKQHNDWGLYEIYEETVEGGLLFDNRKEDGGKKLMEDARAGRFNLVLVWDNDRVGRARDGLSGDIFRHDMRELGIQVYSLNQPYLLKEPEEFKDNPYDDGVILNEKLQDWQSGSSVNKFRLRSMEGRRRRASEGKGLTTPAYGYKLEPRRDENGQIIVKRDGRIEYVRAVNKKEAKIVIRIYHEYVFEGGSFNEIRDGLNADKIPAKKGGLWERASVARVLKNPVYYGLGVYNQHFRRKISLYGGCKWGLNPKEKWIVVPPEKTEWKPIISKDIFDKAQQIRLAKLKIGAVAVYNDFLFSGLLRSGDGSKMHRTKVTSYYKRRTDGITTKSQCNGYVSGRWQRFRDADKNYISEKDLKEYVLSDLSKFKNDPSVLEGFLEQSKQKELNQAKEILDSKRKTLSDIPRRSGRIFKAYEVGSISLPKFTEATLRLDELEKDLRKEISELEKKVGLVGKKELGRKDFLEAVQKFEEIFASKDIKAQKDFLRSLIESIVVEDGKITINYLLSSQEGGE